ncbi:MAG TPA: ATP-binding protein [Allosphingosinicella sp.]|nr:ATP-binding protein [Allosphingosinicella sp.]
MNAEAAIPLESNRPRWRRRIAVFARRSGWAAVAEGGIVVLLLVVLAASYLIVTRTGTPESPLSPELIAGLVVANLVPAMALMVMVARRLAIRRAVRSDIGGKGRLHVRLVALFSIIASVPTLLVVIFASLLFQSGVKFWFSEQAQTVLTSAENVSQIYEREHRDRVTLDVRTMGLDVVDRINRYGITSQQFRDDFLYQTAARQLTETAIFRIDPRGVVRSQIEVNFDNRPLTRRFAPDILRAMRAGDIRMNTTPDRVEAVVRLDPQAMIYFYGARLVNGQAIGQIQQAQNAASVYKSTLENTRRLQVRFNVILILVSLALIALSIWIALALADRLVRPIGQLVDAARKVTAGDLAARVPASDERDEVGTLGNAFNRMTRRLEEQTGALVSANAQLDSRRAFTEAVLSGVTAGVISVDDRQIVRLINSSAETLLKTGGKSPVGQKLADLAPELDRQLTAEEREDVVQLASSGEPRTLAVKTVKVEGGHVLTFDDITEQLMDQRRAAWSDVARRIAHEIKNPLTPIQLAAERLQRRYGAEVTSDQATFERLTGTIVRQVGDLRRMVDEFSSFARMPKPAFHEESLAEIARQALFLHEVAHPDIEFSLDVPDPAPTLVSDRRLLGQALTNVVKNGVEAIQQKREEKKRRKPTPDRVAIAISEQGSKVSIEVSDTGIGLPAQRARMTEPYMTTRAKGTGLGLAIVKKIVEEHFGQIEFEDAAGGGSVVRMIFDRQTLAQLAGTVARYSEENIGTS